MSKRTEAAAAEDGGDNEASRLKKLAEEKYEMSDYTSALKYAKRAQRLDPNLGGLTEMVTALRILRAAQEKSDGLVSHDWYTILQLEPFSSVDVVKKRYKNLALALHPDKTSFVGCGEAFKLVGDAFRCLVSVERRKEFDLKLRVWIQDQALKNGEEEEVVVERFWSRCDGCGMICRFDRKYILQSLVCSGCKKSFVAIEVERSDDSDVTLSDEDTDGDVGGEEPGVSGKLGGMKKGRESIVVYSRRKKLSDASGSVVQAGRSGGEVRSERLREKRKNVIGEEMTLAELQLEAKKRKKSVGEKTTRKAVRGRPSFEAEEELRGNVLRNKSRKNSKTNATNSEEDDSETEMIRLSTLKKKKVDVAKSSRVSRKSLRDEANVESEHLEDRNFEVMTVEDSDFYDFDKDRVEKSFKKGQVWAIYDDEDGMPRHYSLINQVISTNPFEINMSWLEPQMNNDDISYVAGSESHVSCGRFKVDKKTVINSVNFFSHVVNSDRAAREIYRIYPKKGSVWALYNEHDEDKRSFSIVVFLTSYSEMHGLSMAYLDKVNGFKTLFKRQQIGARAVTWMENVNVQLFSHQIPARKLSEVEGPMFKDCWELDPAALPQIFLKNGYGK